MIVRSQNRNRDQISINRPALYWILRSSNHEESKRSIISALVLIYNKSLLTSLALVLCPAAFAEVSVDGGRLAGCLSNSRPGADITTLSFVLVGYDIVVLHRVQDFGPVQCGQVAEIWVFLQSHSSSGDIHQAMEAELPQLEHLEHH